MAVENPSRLKLAGPIEPEHGFPLWFEDDKGVRLELGLTPDPLTPAVGELPQPGAPIQFPGNFPDESFYFMAEARLPVGGNGITGRARVILALEAAFGGAGTPKVGMNVVFARIRVRMDDLIPGAKYTVTHPYGETDPLEADDRGRVFYTEDLGIVEGDPTAVLRTGQVAPFLRGASAVPEGYIGDGVTEQQVTGSPFNTNFVKIAGPRIREGGGRPEPSDPQNPDLVWTDLFTVQGKIAKRVGAWVEGATYATQSDGNLLTVLARSAAGQDLRLVGGGIHLKLEGDREFYSGIGRITTPPAELNDARLVNISDEPPTSYPVQFTDLVIVESAIHNSATQTLTLKAKSSDSGAVLTLPQFSDLQLTANPQTIPNLGAVPAEILVKSSRGGAGRQKVELVGNPAVNLPVKAIIAPVPEAFVGEEVTLDGSSSLGATSFTWTQIAGSSSVPGSNAAKLSFTPTVAGEHAFSLTVTDNNSSDTATVTLTVKPELGPDTLSVTAREYRTSKRQFRLSGTVNPAPNEVVVTFRNVELGRANADITGAWSVRRTLLESETNLVPAPGDAVQVDSKRASQTTSLNIRN